MKTLWYCIEQLLIGVLIGQAFVRMCNAILEGQGWRAFVFLLVISVSVSYWSGRLTKRKQ